MVTLALFLIGVLSLLFFDPSRTAFIAGVPLLQMIIRFFTHMVSHGSWDHILGNYIFGLPYMWYAEKKIGKWWKFLLLFIVCGGVGLAGQLCFDLQVYHMMAGMIGSSAAIFGIVAYACFIADEAWWIKWPARVLGSYFALTQALAIWSVLNGALSFVGYAAHLGGILCGISLALSSEARGRLLSRISGWLKSLH